MASAFKAWALFISFILVIPFILWLSSRPFKIRIAKLENENRELRAHADAIESRLQLATEANAGEAKTLDEILADIAELRQLIQVETEPSVVEPIIKEVDVSAAAQVMANRTTNHILTAEKLAIGGTRGRHPGRDSHEKAFPSPIFMTSLLVLALTLLVLFAIRQANQTLAIR